MIKNFEIISLKLFSFFDGCCIHYHCKSEVLLMTWFQHTSLCVILMIAQIILRGRKHVMHEAHKMEFMFSFCLAIRL